MGHNSADGYRKRFATRWQRREIEQANPWSGLNVPPSTDLLPQDWSLGAKFRSRMRRTALAMSIVVVVMAVSGGAYAWVAFNGIPRFSDNEVSSRSFNGAVPALAPEIISEISQLPVWIEGNQAWGGDELSPVELDPSLAELLFATTTTTAPPPPALSQGEVVVFGVFSTGTTRITDEQALEIGVWDADKRGSDKLSDVLMLLLVNPSNNKMTMLSIPRDTWMPTRDERINATFAQYGSQALADDLALVTGLRIDHLVQINMMGFVQLTNAVGGVSMSVAEPMRDAGSGLAVEAGVQRFDGRTALQWVRSRHVEVLRDDEWISDDSADFGRMQRQQTYLRALLAEAWSFDVVTKIPALVNATQSNLTIDDDLSISDLVDLGQRMRSGSGQLPGRRIPVSGGFVGKRSVLFADPWPVYDAMVKILADLGVQQ